MAGPYYVDDGAGGANDGTSWTDAWTSYASADSVVGPGEIVYVASSHDEDIGTVTLDHTSSTSAANPARIISATKYCFVLNHFESVSLTAFHFA